LIGRYQPTELTYNCVLSACAELGDIEISERIHKQIISSDIKCNIELYTILIKMYTKCGKPEKYLSIWNEVCQKRIQPTEVTYICVLSTCSELGDIEIGERINKQIISSGIKCNIELYNILIKMYTKCGKPEKSLSIWNEVCQKIIQPTEVTYNCVLSACAYSSSLEQGKKIHDLIINNEVKLNTFLYAALINMYAKCLSLSDACTIFNTITQKDISIWNTMIQGYSFYGFGKKAHSLFIDMTKSGIQPNYITFISLLNGFSHSGMVSEAISCYNSMKKEFNITPTIEHQTCVVWKVWTT